MRAAGHSERASVLRPGCTELARLGADELAKRRHFRIGEFLIARHAVGDERAVADDLVERRGILRHRRGAKVGRKARRLDVHPMADEAAAAIDRRTLFRERRDRKSTELQSLMRTSYAVFCLKKKKTTKSRK